MGTISTVFPNRRKKLRINAGYFFVAPAVILIILLAIYPTFRVIRMSLFSLDRRSGIETFVGLQNYARLIKDPLFPKVFRQTLQFSFFSSLGHITLGFFLALLLNAGLNRKFLGACRSLVLLPWALSPIVVAIIAQLWAYPLTSPIAKILTDLGFQGDFAPLATPVTALWTLTLINIWQFTPFYMLMILAGIQSMDPELHDAAKVDGASTIMRIRFITLPHVRDLILTLSLFDLVTTTAYFDLIWVTTQGGPVRSTEVLATYIYRIAFGTMDWNRASAIGLVLLILCIGISAVVLLQMQKDKK
jgi:ABC-type sugar transport system permease subunit